MAGSYLLYNELHYNGLMTDLGLCRSPFFVEVSVETSAMTAGDVPALGKLNAAEQRVFYVGLAFAVKVEMNDEVVQNAFCSISYWYMGRYNAKE